MEPISNIIDCSVTIASFVFNVFWTVDENYHNSHTYINISFLTRIVLTIMIVFNG